MNHNVEAKLPSLVDDIDFSLTINVDTFKEIIEDFILSLENPINEALR